MIEIGNSKLSIKNQCSILDISQSGYYYKPAPISEYNLFLMKQIDEIFTEGPEYGRALDNIVIERFWRTIKYGEVYLKDYENSIETVHGISKYIEKCNSRRPHDSLGERTPDEVYFETSEYGLNQIKIS